MQRLKFINSRGAEAVFDDSGPYIFWKIDGLSLPEVLPIPTRAAGQDGYTLQELRLESRTVTLTGHIIGVGSRIYSLYEERKRLNSVCNPLLGPGRLVYSNDYGEWRIPAFCSAMPYEEKIRHAQTLNVEFECPSPFWLSATQSVVSLAYVYGGMSFPIRTPNRFGTLGYRAIISNDSDAETPLEFLIDGGSLNPVITNTTTGRFIKLNKQLFAGDQLYINTDPEKLEVSHITTDPETNQRVKSKAYGYLTHDSELFSLIPGENRLTFKSDDENKKVKITITFYKRYVGV